MTFLGLAVGMQGCLNTYPMRPFVDLKVFHGKSRIGFGGGDDAVGEATRASTQPPDHTL